MRKRAKLAESPRYVRCPVCTAQVSAAFINEHLDSHLDAKPPATQSATAAATAATEATEASIEQLTEQATHSRPPESLPPPPPPSRETPRPPPPCEPCRSTSPTRSRSPTRSPNRRCAIPPGMEGTALGRAFASSPRSRAAARAAASPAAAAAAAVAAALTCLPPISTTSSYMAGYVDAAGEPYPGGGSAAADAPLVAAAHFFTSGAGGVYGAAGVYGRSGGIPCDTRRVSKWRVPPLSNSERSLLKRGRQKLHLFPPPPQSHTHS